MLLCTTRVITTAFRTFAGCCLSLTLVLAGSLAGVGAVEAAGSSPKPGGISVRILPIRPDSVAPGGRALVRPNLRFRARTEVASATLDIRSDKGVLKRGVRSARLPVGNYAITTKVRFRTWRGTRTTHSIAPGELLRVARTPNGYRRYLDECTIFDVYGTDTEGTFRLTCSIAEFTDKDDLRSTRYPVINIDGTYGPTSEPQFTHEFLYGEERVLLYGGPYPSNMDGTTIEHPWTPKTVVASSTLTGSDLDRAYSEWQHAQRVQTVRVTEHRPCATYRDFKKIRANFDEPDRGHTKREAAKILHSRGTRSSFSDYGTYTIEFRRYATCDDDAEISIGFVDDGAYSKQYST